jgi:hypothetical protein
MTDSIPTDVQLAARAGAASNAAEAFAYMMRGFARVRARQARIGKALATIALAPITG